MNANLSDEAEIIWIHPPDRYDFLRESVAAFPHRRHFPKRMMPRHRGTQAGNGTHLVAYAVAGPAASGANGGFCRRYWWVKVHDRWDGHGTDGKGDFYQTNCPVEAVQPESIHAGKPSAPGCHETPRQPFAP